jgi:hypothetical protein
VRAAQILRDVDFRLPVPAPISDTPARFRRATPASARARRCSASTLTILRALGYARRRSSAAPRRRLTATPRSTALAACQAPSQRSDPRVIGRRFRRRPARGAGDHRSVEPERVTAIAKELEAAVSGLRDAVKNSPAWDNPQQKRNLYKIADILRQIEQESTSLHAQLAKGAGMERPSTTIGIQTPKRRAEALAPKSDVTAFTKPKLDRATEVLSSSEPFYPPLETRK